MTNNERQLHLNLFGNWYGNHRGSWRHPDGFNYKAPIFPDGFEVFVEHVVPELQKRGIYRKEYTGRTLRENLGLPNPTPTVTR